MPVAVIRCGNIYGGGSELEPDRPGHDPFFLANESPVIRSDGTFVRDYVYVKDVARTYLDVAERLMKRNLGRGLQLQQ